MNRPLKRSPLAFLSRVAIVAFALAGCQAQMHESGVILNEDALSRIHPGITTRNQVFELLGPPTLVNPYRANRWLYIQDRKYKNMQRTFARVANRIEISFDRGGVVSDIQKNFDDKPWDPTTIPEANSDKGWMNWLWDTGYAHPAVNPHGPPMLKRSLADDSPIHEEPVNTSSGEKKPWWKFWSRDGQADAKPPATPSDAIAGHSSGDEALPGFLTPTERLRAPLNDPLAFDEKKSGEEADRYPSDALAPAQEELREEAQQELVKDPPKKSDSGKPWWKFWARDPLPDSSTTPANEALKDSGVGKE
ncbi:MAG: outer membrane protein assembly factor BamE [Magnetococcus sp. YQC-9]